LRAGITSFQAQVLSQKISINFVKIFEILRLYVDLSKCFNLEKKKEHMLETCANLTAFILQETCIAVGLSNVLHNFSIRYINHRNSGTGPHTAAHKSESVPALHIVCPTFEYLFILCERVVFIYLISIKYNLLI
jgi:hypothetical protein